MNGFRILAICSGNVCRSPLVELLLKRAFDERPDFVVESAGTIARPGQHMTGEMIAVATRYGITADMALAHKASRLTEVAVEEADLVLGLTKEHRAGALQLFPAAVRRTFTLKEFARLAASLEVNEVLPVGSADLVALAAQRRTEYPATDPAGDDVDDPIGRSQEVYDRVGAEVADAVRTVARVIASTRPADRHRTGVASDRKGPKLSFSFREV